MVAHTLRALKPRHFGKHNRGKRESEAQEHLCNQERAQLAVISRRLNGAGYRVPDFPGHHEDVVQVFGAELAERERQVGERCHDRKEGGLEMRRRRIGDPDQHGDHGDLAEW